MSLQTGRAAFAAEGWWRCALFLVVPVALFAQDTVPFDSDVVIRATTNLVQVRVIAEDSQGRLVTDLQRSDFSIDDDRKPQSITLFSADLGTVAAPSAASKSPDSPSAGSIQAPPGYAVLLLDWLNIPYEYRVKAQKQVIALLEKYQPRQKVAIYLLDHDPRLLHDFTSNMPELIQVVEDAGLDAGMMTIDLPVRYVGRAVANADEYALLEQNRVFDTLHTLKVISDHLAHVPGRKTLIWLSAGFPFTAAGIDFIPRFETALAQMNKADIGVYTVNSCGLTIGCRNFGNSMYEMASRTGGMVFGARNDLDESMRSALEDMRISYTLGFNVPEGAAPGLHEIRVRVNRPGIKLRYRESYNWAGVVR